MDVLVYVKKEIAPMINFALKEYNKIFKVTIMENSVSLEGLLSKVKSDFILVLDSVMHDKNMAAYAKEIKSRCSKAKILYMMDTETPRTELLELIQSNTISKALVKPFTARQLTNNIFELSGHDKPDDSAWFNKKQ